MSSCRKAGRLIFTRPSARAPRRLMRGRIRHVSLSRHPKIRCSPKLEWFRLGGETSERQWWDIVGVLKVTQDADRGYLRRWADSLAVADLLERAFADAVR